MAVPNEGYFYPRAAYAPLFLQKGTASSPYLAKKITHKTVEYIPYPFQNLNYFYPAPYLQTPLTDKPKAFKSAREIKNESSIQDSTSNEGLDWVYRTLPKSIVSMKAPNILKIDETEGQKGRSMKSKGQEDESSDDVSLMEDIIRIVAADDMEEIKEIMKSDTTTLSPLRNDKFIMIDAVIDKKIKKGRQENSLTDEPAERAVLHTTKSTLPNDKIIKLTVTPTTPLPKTTQKPKRIAEEKAETTTKKEGLGLKFPKFPFFQKEPEITPNALDTIREGGIVIQRLKVRRGGIAIAGPGGVATAGSGGTAIVGPGGVAVTHPRGLSIAGPGAKIYAFPETQDLQEVAQKIQSRSLKHDGVLVATGPVVYYHL